MTKDNKKFRPYIAIHPGITLEEIIEDKKMTQIELSKRIGISHVTINDIIKGRNPITPETAIKLERIFGISAVFWNNLQKNYDETLAYLEDQKNMVKEVNLARRYSCYRELAEYGVVRKTKDWIEKARELMNFFQVSSLSAVPDIEVTAFRKNATKDISYECLAAWIRWGHIEAGKVELPSFDLKKVKELIPEFRKLTRENPEVFSKKLKELCKQCGIALIFTPYVSKTYANGATRWLGSGNPMIQISLRNRYTDIFWFTFFHELGHILMHSKKYQFIEIDGEDSNSVEIEADEFACNTLIPEVQYKAFVGKNRINSLSITNFADSINISSEIVAGRIGHDFKCWAKVERMRSKLKFSKKD